METAERILQRLEFTVVRRLDGMFFGDYTGIFYGPSLDLAEVREYQPGDEVRRIDWNVTARTNRLYVRQYLEERELTAWLVVDRSPSMGFGTRRHLKAYAAAEFAGVAAYIVSRHGDKVGAMVFPSDHAAVVPPRSGRRHALRILHTVATAPEVGAGSPTDLGAALEQAARTMRRRSLVFLVSDFLAPDGWEGSLRRLAQRHDLIAVRITDPAELELPDVGGLHVRDPETGAEVFVDTSDPQVRRAYRALVAERETRLRETFRAARVDALAVSTAEPLIDPLVRFITFRRRRRWNSSGR